jgi:hypothetical protein
MQGSLDRLGPLPREGSERTFGGTHFVTTMPNMASVTWPGVNFGNSMR